MHSMRVGRRAFIASSSCVFAGFTSGCSSAADRGASAVSTVPGKETDGKQFVQFLKDCTPAERIQLAQSLQVFPDLENEDFGKFGLPPYDKFVDDPKSASQEKPLRPASFNELPPSIVLEAIRAGRVNGELSTPYRIIGALLHTCQNEILTLGSNRDKVDYHSIVQWVARKKGVDTALIDSANTYDLEQAVAKQCLAKIWDQLSVEQRQELLGRIEKQTGSTIADKAAIAAMGGGAAIAALGTTVAMTGFAFYTTMAVVISSAAGMLGLTLPMWAYVGASSTVAILSGPVGWSLAALGIAGGIAYLVLADAEKTASFVMTMNVIKANRLQAQAQKPR